MRIGISCYPTFGGSGVVATELAMALADGGDEVHVISYALPSRLSLLAPSLFFHEVVVPHYPLFEYPPYSLALASKMAEVARHQKLDLMHVHYAVPNAISAILAKQILAPQPLAAGQRIHLADQALEAVAEVVISRPQGRLFSVHARLLTALMFQATGVFMSAQA